MVRLNALTGATLSLPALTSIPDGAVQVLATNPNSVADLSALATFVDNTGGGNSFIEAQDGGRVKMPALTAPQFTNLVIDGAASQMDVAQITSVQKDNVFARNGATVSLPGITNLAANSFTTIYQAESGATLAFPNLSVLHGATGFSVVELHAFGGATLSAPVLTSIPDGAVQVQAINPNSIVDLSALTSFTDNTGAGDSQLEAQDGGRVKIPLLTTTHALNFVIDGAASKIDTAQLTSLPADNVFARAGASVSFDGITGISSSAVGILIQAESGATITLPNLTTLHGATGFTFVELHATGGGTVSAPALTSIPDGAVILQADGTGSSLNLPALASFAGNNPSEHSVLNVLSGATGQLTAGTLSLTGVDVTADGSLTAGTLQIATGSRLFGVGTIHGNVTNSGEVDPGDSAGLLTITGNYTQTASGLLNLEIDGLTAGSLFDQLSIGGTATLAGTVNFFVGGGFQPAPGQTFPVLLASSINGTFGTVSGTNTGNGHTFSLTYSATTATVSVS